MHEYRWFFCNREAQFIAADRGRFLTDADAISWAADLLAKHATAAAVEIWDGTTLVGRRARIVA